MKIKSKNKYDIYMCVFLLFNLNLVSDNLFEKKMITKKNRHNCEGSMLNTNKLNDIGIKMEIINNIANQYSNDKLNFIVFLNNFILQILNYSHLS